MAMHADRDGGENPLMRIEVPPREDCADRAREEGYVDAFQVEWWVWMFGCSRYDTEQCRTCKDSYAVQDALRAEKALLKKLDASIAEGEALLNAEGI